MLMVGVNGVHRRVGSGSPAGGREITWTRVTIVRVTGASPPNP